MRAAAGHSRSRARQVAPGIWVALALWAASARAQDLGHKVPGTLGLYAARQPDPGLTVADLAAYYPSDTLRDRNGEPAPVQGFRLRAFANGFGLSATVRAGPVFFNFAASIPIASVDLSVQVPEASIDKFGLADARVQPFGLGWRSRQVELVTSYALYIPTRHTEPGSAGDLGRGAFSHELSLGGTAFFDPQRRWFFSALASYELNQRKQGVDITRGDTVQLQGGVGVEVLPLLDLGVAGYALWQVRDDRGSDLPQQLRGARDRVFGVGPEAGLLLPKLRTRISLRYEHDLGVESRPDGQILCLTVAWQLWRFSPPGR